MATELIKTNRKMAEFEGMEPEFEAQLELYDRKRNHNKFWRIWVYGCFVVRHWGRHGTKGQSAVHMAWSETNARWNARELVGVKRNSGYGKEASFLDRFAREVD